MITARSDRNHKEVSASYVERITNPKRRTWYLRVSFIAMCIALSIGVCIALSYWGIYKDFTSFADSIVARMVYWSALMASVVARTLESQIDKENEKRKDEYLARVKSAEQSQNVPNQ
jgi:hypothetical protein